MKPEKIVEQEVLSFCSQLGLDVSTVESKASYSAAANRYKRGVTEVGFSDLIGNDQTGKSCYIELKAKGKINNLSEQQRKFLLRKASQGCFAVCVDSGPLLVDLYLEWKEKGSIVLINRLEKV